MFCHTRRHLKLCFFFPPTCPEAASYAAAGKSPCICFNNAPLSRVQKLKSCPDHNLHERLLLCLPAHTQADSTRAGKTLFLLSTLLHPREADKITRERRRSHRTDATACCTTVSTDFPAAASLQPVTEIS